MTYIMLMQIFTAVELVNPVTLMASAHLQIQK